MKEDKHFSTRRRTVGGILKALIDRTKLHSAPLVLEQLLNKDIYIYMYLTEFGDIEALGYY